MSNKDDAIFKSGAKNILLIRDTTTDNSVVLNVVHRRKEGTRDKPNRLVLYRVKSHYSFWGESDKHYQEEFNSIWGAYHYVLNQDNFDTSHEIFRVSKGEERPVEMKFLHRNYEKHYLKPLEKVEEQLQENDSLKCVMFDLNSAGERINLLYIEDKLPEKRYRDYCDYYGDIRDYYETLDTPVPTN